jgi:hypothetical protein
MSNRNAKAKLSTFANFGAKTQTMRRYFKRRDLWKSGIFRIPEEDSIAGENSV